MTDVTPAMVIGRDEMAQMKTGIEVGIAGWGQQTQGSETFGNHQSRALLE